MLIVAPVTVRTGEAADHSALIGVDTYASAHPSRAESLREALSRGECLVAEAEGVAIGYAVLNYTFFGFGFVPLIVVAPSRRRLGVGSALLRKARAQCTSRKLFTSANASNEAAQSLFRAAGFTRSGVIENLDADDPELVYFMEVGT